MFTGWGIILIVSYIKKRSQLISYVKDVLMFNLFITEALDIAVSYAKLSIFYFR